MNLRRYIDRAVRREIRRVMDGFQHPGFNELRKIGAEIKRISQICLQEQLVLAKNDPEAASYIGHVKSHIPAISQYVAKTIQALDSFNSKGTFEAAREVYNYTDTLGVVMKRTKETKKLFYLGRQFFALAKSLASYQLDIKE